MKLRYNPYGLIIDQTTLCVQNCYFCYRSDPKNIPEKVSKASKILDLDIYKKIIDQTVQINSLTFLSLCGPLGEPLMVPDIVERIEYAANKNHFKTILINSNGQLLHKHDLERLIKSCSIIQISVDSTNRATYEKIHCKGDFEKVFENIESLLKVRKISKNGSLINVRFTEGDYNKGEWKEFNSFFKNKVNKVLHVKEHSFMGVNKKYQNDMGTVLCNQPFGNINFNVNGEMTTCCVNWKLEPTFGSIKNRTIKEMWESDEFELWRKDRIKTTCLHCGGLGGFQQKPTFMPTEQEKRVYEKIVKYGASRYYKNRDKIYHLDNLKAVLFKVLRKLKVNVLYHKMNDFLKK